MKIHKYKSNQGDFYVMSGETTKPIKGSSLSDVAWMGWAEPGGKNITEMTSIGFSKDVEEEKSEKQEKPGKRASILSVADFVRKLAAPVAAPAKEGPSVVEEGKEGAKFIHVYAPKDKSHAEFVLSDSKSEKPIKKTLNLTSMERPGRMLGSAVAYIKKNLGKLLDGTEIPMEELDTLTLFEDKQTGIPVIVYAKGKVNSDVVGQGGWIKSVSAPVLTKKVEKGVGEPGGIQVKKLSAAETVRELVVAIANTEQGV